MQADATLVRFHSIEYKSREHVSCERDRGAMGVEIRVQGAVLNLLSSPTQFISRANTLQFFAHESQEKVNTSIPCKRSTYAAHGSFY